MAVEAVAIQLSISPVITYTVPANKLFIGSANPVDEGASNLAAYVNINGVHIGIIYGVGTDTDPMSLKPITGNAGDVFAVAIVGGTANLAGIVGLLYDV